MSSSSAVPEIVEAKEDLDLVHHFKGSNSLSNKVKAEGKSSSSGYPAYDELHQLIKAIDLRTLSRAIFPTHQIATELPKSALKKPIKVGVVSQASGKGISESVTLKQALRKLCISQASEMAATKRLSKSFGLPDVSEAGTIKRLLASVVVPTSECEDKGNLVEISLVPEKSMQGLSKNSFIHNMSKFPSSSQTSVCSPYRANLPPAKVQKTRIQDVIASIETADDPSAPMEIRVKGKAKSKKSIVYKPGLRSKTIVIKKGKQQPQSIPASSSKCNEMNTEDVVPSKTKLACQEESISLASTCTNPSESMVMIKNKDDVASKSDVNAHGFNVGVVVGAKIHGNTRKRLGGIFSKFERQHGRYSTTTSISDESHQSSSGSGTRPHMSKDVKMGGHP